MKVEINFTEMMNTTFQIALTFIYPFISSLLASIVYIFGLQCGLGIFPPPTRSLFFFFVFTLALTRPVPKRRRRNSLCNMNCHLMKTKKEGEWNKTGGKKKKKGGFFLLSGHEWQFYRLKKAFAIFLLLFTIKYRPHIHDFRGFAREISCIR